MTVCRVCVLCGFLFSFCYLFLLDAFSFEVRYIFTCIPTNNSGEQSIQNETEHNPGKWG